MLTCKNCDQEGDEKFCSRCGQVLVATRISLPHIIHEVIHTFTHFEKGYLFTIRQLLTRPGIMQKNYLSGLRLHYQKPFPVFVISGTICALALYLIYTPSHDTAEQFFYRNYYVLVQALMLPIYALLSWILFSSSRLYYAEMLVLNVYMLGFMSLIVIPVNALHFFLNNGVVTLIEATLLTAYNIWTYLNFFKGKPAWLIAIKSAANVILSFVLFQVAANLLMKWLM